MGSKTTIEWTQSDDGSPGSTWSPVRGCSRVSPGCELCYAERIAARFSGPGMAYEGLAEMRNGKARWTGEVRFLPEQLAVPLRWKKPRRVFVCSTSDLFHEKVTNEQIAAVFGVMATASQNTFLVLTKRAERMREWFAWVGSEGKASRSDTLGYLNSRARDALLDHHKGYVVKRVGQDWPLSNCWLGVSVEDQRRADERIPHLVATPAAVRFLSVEPMLGPVALKHWLEPLCPRCTGTGSVHVDGGGMACPACFDTKAGSPGPLPSPIQWIIAGAESGPGARPCSDDWLRALRNQCRSASVAFFLKQQATPTGRKIHLPMLDGRQWVEFPRV